MPRGSNYFNIITHLTSGLYCNKKLAKSNTVKNIKKTSTFLSEKLPFFMPLIVFIETVGISQKNIEKTLALDICTGRQKKILHCAILKVPQMNYYETNMSFWTTVTSAAPQSYLDLKIMLFLLFVVFIQLPMVCVTFSEKSYLVPSYGFIMAIRVHS